MDEGTPTPKETKMIPTATITEKHGTEVEGWRTFDGNLYVVADELGTWGIFENYTDAADRLKTRRKVEKAMKTRRANKAKRA